MDIQIEDYVSLFSITPEVAIANAVKNAAKDPLGAVSVAIEYSLIPHCPVKT